MRYLSCARQFDGSPGHARDRRTHRGSSRQQFRARGSTLRTLPTLTDASQGPSSTNLLCASSQTAHRTCAPSTPAAFDASSWQIFANGRCLPVCHCCLPCSRVLFDAMTSVVRLSVWFRFAEKPSFLTCPQGPKSTETDCPRLTQPPARCFSCALRDFEALLFRFLPQEISRAPDARLRPSSGEISCGSFPKSATRPWEQGTSRASRMVSRVRYGQFRFGG
jgi:hypothetical protein